MPPTTTEGIKKYLGSGMIRGIGPAYARKLVGAFGGQVFDVIEAEPHRLREVAGIGPKRADGIATGWAEQRAIRDSLCVKYRGEVDLEPFECQTIMRSSFRASAGPVLVPSLFRGGEQMVLSPRGVRPRSGGSWSEFSR
jgi:Helix-hairpin-helix domain